MTNEINKSIDQLLTTITTSNTYKEYLLLKEQAKNDNYIVSIINEIKSLQKEIVHGKDEKVLSDKIDQNLDKLYSVELYKKLIDKTDQVNMAIDEIKITLENYFTDLIN